MSNLQSRPWLTKLCWLILVGCAAIFALLYLGFSLFPGQIDPSIHTFASAENANNARVYNTPPRILYIIKFFLQALLLFGLLFSRWGKSLFRMIQRICPWDWLGFALAIILTWFLLHLLSLPFTYFTSYYWPTNWGLRTQSQVAWWIDYTKTAGIGLFITLIGGLIVFWLVNRFNHIWWLIGATLFSFWLVTESLLWPVLISPLFNQFETLADPAIVMAVEDLAQQASLEISDVLVMDASKQTSLANAYFSGVGATKRIVIYDTLLRNYSLPEVKAVLAHEMGHWLHKDILRGLFLGMIGCFIAFGLLNCLLQPWLPQDMKKTPQLWAAIQLALLLILFVSNPLQNTISRDMESKADRFSLELTGDPAAAIQLQKHLALEGLADLSPPPYIVWFSYSHPPALERIRAFEEQLSAKHHPTLDEAFQSHLRYRLPTYCQNPIAPYYSNSFRD